MHKNTKAVQRGKTQKNLAEVLPLYEKSCKIIFASWRRQGLLYRLNLLRGGAAPS